MRSAYTTFELLDHMGHAQQLGSENVAQDKVLKPRSRFSLRCQIMVDFENFRAPKSIFFNSLVFLLE